MRPQLIFGMEQKAFGVLFVLSFLLLAGTRGTVLMILPLVILFVGVIKLKKANQKDAQFFAIYLRMSRFKQSYFPARSGCLAKSMPVRSSISMTQN